MVNGGVPDMLNVIVTGFYPTLVFTFKIACRSDPIPLSPVVVTVYGSPKTFWETKTSAAAAVYNTAERFDLRRRFGMNLVCLDCH